jgi:hypothetical protein
MSLPACFAADLAIILFLYGLKAILFRFVHSSRLLLGCFLTGLALAVPVTWLTSPDWDNEHVYRIAIWVGCPVGVLAVPCISFFVDFIRRGRDMGRWFVRVPIEVLAVAPAWLYLWAWIQLLILGWIWI